MPNSRSASPQLILLCLALLLFGSVNTSFAQSARLSGHLIDSIGKPVVYANLIATPTHKDAEITFAITDQEGRYKLKLKTGIWYRLEITSLGFSPRKDSIKISADTVKNFQLNHSSSALEKVVVEAKMAMIVKEDTITYRTDQFKTGDERKLSDILEHLPGVEVDRHGNVMVNGKKVTKLLVDGKPFFGGDVQLGVQNIPSDAVDEVEVIDDYHEVAFMKGLSESDRMAMNIKLKEDKKEFVFGEIEAGGGVKERYLLHPTLFYYSDKTTFNFIGSVNNVNESPLDWDDVRRFKGGVASFLNNPIQSSNAGLSAFSSSNEVIRNKTLFGALNFTQQISQPLRLTAYSIVAKQRSATHSTKQLTYLTTNTPLTEQRNAQSEREKFSNFNKIRLRYKPSYSKDLAYDLVANFSNSDYGTQLVSQLADSSSFTTMTKAPEAVEISQYLRYNTQPTYEHTSEITAFYTYKTRNSLTDWTFDRPVFVDLIPAITDGSAYNFLHDYGAITNTGRINFKHYWVLNSTNHIYPVAGLYYYHQTYNSTDFQRLQNGNINSFATAGFNNALSFQLIDPYIGVQYKFKLGDIVFRPGVIYHHYRWQVDQFNNRLTDREKGVFLPEMQLKYEPSSVSELEFNYNLKASFAEASSYANRLRLTSFNALYRGNPDLENALYHEFDLHYRHFSHLHGFNYFLQLGYKRQEKAIRTTSRLEGIDRIMTSIYTDLPENSYNFYGRFHKRWPKLSAGIGSRVLLSTYSRIVNHNKIDYDGQVYTVKINGRTRFEEWPNLSVGIQQTFRNSASDDTKNHYWSFEPYINLDYAFLNGFILKLDYQYSYSKDQTSGRAQQFQIGDASLYYRKEGSPWGFEIRINNIFDVNYKRYHYFSEYLVFDMRRFIQPRTALFILSYQL